MSPEAWSSLLQAPGQRQPPMAERQMAGAVRAALGADHPAVGMADVATGLWSRALRFDATEPAWPDRDRVVVSAGHASALLYAMLHLTGYPGMEADVLRRVGQLDCALGPQAELGAHPGIEATVGPPGQGLAMAVGLALAERMMAARFGRSLVDHRTWVLACHADLMQGVSHEAACLAGQLRLERLVVLLDDGAGAGDDEALKRFAAAGWATKRVDGRDLAAIAGALSAAVRSKKPVLLAFRTGASAIDGPSERFDDADALWQRAGTRGLTVRRAWRRRLVNHPLRAAFERMMAGRLPEAWDEATGALKAELLHGSPSPSALQACERAITALAGSIPELVGDSSDCLAPSGAAIGPGNYGGRFVHYAAREHAMAACMNGMALHGGPLPFGSARFAATDAMRPALRMAALMRRRVVYVLTHDSIGAGEHGAAHQPVEHLASLRAMPGLLLFRPADAIETVESLEVAVRRADGPNLLVLPDQEVAPVRMSAGRNRCARGAYVIAEPDGPRRATLIASGSEVAVAVEARRLLQEAGFEAAVVSLVCWELFAAQDEAYRAHTLGACLRVGVEAACGFGWERWLGADGIFVGMTGFGASAPGDALYQHFGITPEAIASAVRRRLNLT